MFNKCIENVRENAPLVHNITNYVTVNDVANVILACGASPIMSDDLDEVTDITTICGGLNINIGTLNKNTIPAMFLAGKKANKLGHVVLLDPVGAGASRLRTETAAKLIKEIKFDVIRGNISEVKALMNRVTSEEFTENCGNTKGVDANIADRITNENIDDIIAILKKFSNITGSIIVVTGEIDLVCDDERCFVIRNGRSEMSQITGTGCQLSGMITAFVTANKDNKLNACAAAVCAMGLAGEIGWGLMKPGDGNSTYRNRIIDAIYNLNGEALEQGANYEIR